MWGIGLQQGVFVERDRIDWRWLAATQSGLGQGRGHFSHPAERLFREATIFGYDGERFGEGGAGVALLVEEMRGLGGPTMSELPSGFSLRTPRLTMGVGDQRGATSLKPV